MKCMTESGWSGLVLGILLLWPVSRGRAESPEEERGTLKVEVTELENSKGKVRAGLFTSNRKFPLGVDGVEPIAEAEIVGGEATVVFEGLPHGTYAVVIYHDANANGQLDKNFLGMPREGAGVYKPVDRRFPPPNFGDCHFGFDRSKQTVTVSPRYL